jgi:hypothetical protein
LPYHVWRGGAVEGVLSKVKADHDAVFWALVVAVYHLEQLDDENAKTDIDRMRAILSEFPPKAVSLCFLKAALAFNPPETLEQAQALYDHYGVEAVGLEKMYPEQRPQ